MQTETEDEDRKALRFEVGKTPYDLLACALVALVLILLIAIVPDSIARQVLGLAFVLFLPGYAATAALFPENEQLDTIERLALSFGLSIAIVPLIGLGLNFTPWGIRLNPILASVSAFIIVACVVGWYRRVRLPEDERFEIAVVLDIDWKGTPLMDKALTVGIIVMLTASIVVIAWAVTTPRSGERFTQLAILGPDGMATNYPRNLTIGEEATVLLSVKSYEQQTMNYTIVLVLTNVTEQNFTVDDSFIDWRSTQHLGPFSGVAQQFTLNDQEYYNQTLNFSVAASGEWKLQFLLYVDGQPLTQDSYREVHLWLDVAGVT
ncbi:MAG: DUF1616 domain-containing protein [Methanobacteriota archaeon]|nr:MAG: DUF1616 domain-containing protein [Euryarchaeota archaeon]